ncbi:hypothetical protein QN239_26760 [Mycolicibacterium sp. Y3]
MTSTIPTDAVTLREWVANDGPTFRLFTGSSWVIDAEPQQHAGWGFGGQDITVTICGVQDVTGISRRWVALSAPQDVPVESVPSLIQALTAAHAEAQRLNEGD